MKEWVLDILPDYTIKDLDFLFKRPMLLAGNERKGSCTWKSFKGDILKVSFVKKSEELYSLDYKLKAVNEVGPAYTYALLGERSTALLATQKEILKDASRLKAGRAKSLLIGIANSL